MIKAMTTPTKATPPTIIATIGPRPRLGEEAEFPADGAVAWGVGKPRVAEGKAEVAPNEETVMIVGRDDVDLAPSEVDELMREVGVRVVAGGGGMVLKKADATFSSGKAAIMPSHSAVFCG